MERRGTSVVGPTTKEDHGDDDDERSTRPRGAENRRRTNDGRNDGTRATGTDEEGTMVLFFHGEKIVP